MAGSRGQMKYFFIFSPHEPRYTYFCLQPRMVVFSYTMFINKKFRPCQLEPLYLDRSPWHQFSHSQRRKLLTFNVIKLILTSIRAC